MVVGTYYYSCASPDGKIVNWLPTLNFITWTSKSYKDIFCDD